MDPRTEEQGIGARPHAAAGQPAYLRPLLECEVQPLHEAVGVDGEGVGQDDEVGPVLGFDPDDVLPCSRPLVGGGEVSVLDVEEVQAYVREDGAGYGDCGAVLDLPALPDHPSPRAADKVVDGADVRDDLRDPVVFVPVGIGHKGEKEVGPLPTEVRLHPLCRLPHRSL